MIKTREVPLTERDKAELSSWLHSGASGLARRLARSEILKAQVELANAAYTGVTAPGAKADYEIAVEKIAFWRHFLDGLRAMEQIDAFREPYTE